MFQVVLMEAVEVDDVGSPMASDWLLKAFGSGEATKRRYVSRYKVGVHVILDTLGMGGRSQALNTHHQVR